MVLYFQHILVLCTLCHSPPHRPAAVPPSSSSPAAAAAAVCSVLIGAGGWWREIEAIRPSTAGPPSPSVGEPGRRSSSEKAAGSVSGYHFRNPGRQTVPALPRRGLLPSLPSSSLLPPPYNFFPSRCRSPDSQDGRRSRRPGQAKPRPRALPLPAPSGRGARACALRRCRRPPLHPGVAELHLGFFQRVGAGKSA